MAYLELSINGKWELVGFQSGTLSEVDTTPTVLTRPDETTLKDFVSNKDKALTKLNDLAGQMGFNGDEPDDEIENPWFDGHMDNLNKAKARKAHKKGYTFDRPIQRCTVCGMKHKNRLTCLAHMNGGERVHREQIKPKKWGVD